MNLDERARAALGFALTRDPNARAAIAYKRRDEDFAGWFAGLPETQELAAMLTGEDEFIPKKGAGK